MAFCTFTFTPQETHDDVQYVVYAQAYVQYACTVCMQAMYSMCM